MLSRCMFVLIPTKPNRYRGVLPEEKKGDLYVVIAFDLAASTRILDLLFWVVTGVV